MIIEAYLDAIYRIHAVPTFDFFIGVYSLRLDHLLASCGRETAVLLTAFNPGGILQEAPSNQIIQNQLLLLLEATPYDLFPAEGLSPKGNWPGEDSVLIAGMELEEGVTLGQSFRQNALVFARSGKAPQLILLK